MNACSLELKITDKMNETYRGWFGLLTLQAFNSDCLQREWFKDRIIFSCYQVGVEINPG